MLERQEAVQLLQKAKDKWPSRRFSSVFIELVTTQLIAAFSSLLTDGFLPLGNCNCAPSGSHCLCHLATGVICVGTPWLAAHRLIEGKAFKLPKLMVVTFCQEHIEKCSYKLILLQISEGSQAVAENGFGLLGMGITARFGRESLGFSYLWKTLNAVFWFYYTENQSPRFDWKFTWMGWKCLDNIVLNKVIFM